MTDLSAPLPTAGMVPAPAIGGAGANPKTAADYPTKFEQVAPGSTILVGGQGVPEPFQATVLEMDPEYGPIGIPALYIVDSRDGTEYVISASGLYTVQVLVDARQVAASMPAPENAVKVRTIQRTADAVQFKGGIESATEIVRWAIGSTSFRYVRATDIADDHLVQSGPGGLTAWPGDWIVKMDDGRYTVRDAKAFPTEFEVAP